MTEVNNESKFKRAKRVVAILCVIIMVALLIATFVAACVTFEGSQQVFMALVGIDIIFPVIIWGYMSLVKWASDNDDKLQN